MCIMFWKKKEKADNKVIVSKNIHKNEERSIIMKSDVIIVEEVDEIEEVVEVDEEKKEKIQKYHVSQNKDKEAEFYMKWRVRKESSNKTIQYFETQKLAIDFAQDLANRAGTTVVIHKLDGSIRKQDYSHK